ncbi:hypothetical protein N0V93_010053 [Gnomoniopsis smithogilvyi]|uniref:MARVEL domain-containing protein n=1 Tax=Gnomoniopsis smithogilvyi TaxID=1191159 RepID=A0A9W8YIZ3_9PEZI|nr:hypothetical protein N0V93_010053 [Gnomoniopsis smithogilvyi]
MAESATTHQPTEAANMPEKPAPAQVNTARHHQSLQLAQFQPIDMPKPKPFRPSKPYSVSKVTLGTFNFVFAIIVLGLSIGILTIRLYDIVTILIAGVMAVISILWQIAEYTTIFVRRSIYRPIHPGAHVGMHLILWVLALLVAVSCGFTLSYALGSWTVDSQCAGSDYGYYSSGTSYVYCDYYNFSSGAQARLYLGMLEAVTAFSILMLICHFALFVMACIETDRRRKWGKQTRVVYMVATSGPADGRTYYNQVLPPAPVQQRAGPSPEMHGYYAPPAPGAAAAAAHHATERTQSQEATSGPSAASHA